MLTLLRFTGLVDDRPWPHTLLPWSLYAGIGCVCLAPLIAALAGAGAAEPARSRVLELLTLVAGVAMLVLAVISRRHQRRVLARDRPPEDAGPPAPTEEKQ